MQYFRINTDLKSYRETFPDRDDGQLIQHWVDTGHAYLTPYTGTSQYRRNLQRAGIGDRFFAYQSGSGIVAVGEVKERWDERSHPGDPAIYPGADSMYKLKVAWRKVDPPISFAETGLGTAVGAFSEITESAIGEAIYNICSGGSSAAPMPTKKADETAMADTAPLNQILYGPPGTGKTFATIATALHILDPGFLATNRDARPALKKRFDEFVQSGHVRFVTFHQSFSYEDFVEGLRAESTPEGGLSYRVVPGVFKALCDQAAGNGAANHAGAARFEVGQRFGNGYIVRRATPEILELDKPSGRSLELGMRLLETLADYVRSGAATVGDIADKQVFDKVPDSKLEPFLVNGYSNILPALVAHLLASGTANGNAAAPRSGPAPRVLIIDEINRGNVARIFGELITLIEPSKRAGAGEALETVLPYSKAPFSVPKNVYLIGTMNTADRSLASVDIALRRRFVFKEMAPDLALLRTIRFPGLDLAVLLETINLRIEALLDREHRIGHAYFLPLRDQPTIAQLASIFRLQIVPLLQEYFFEDWERVRWVLNDHRKKPEHQFIVGTSFAFDELFGDAAENLDRGQRRWTVSDKAFDLLDSYIGAMKA